MPNSQLAQHYATEHEQRASNIFQFQSDCFSQECHFFAEMTDSRELSRHIQVCKSSVFKCMSCNEDVRCRKAKHDCQGPKFVLCMLIGGQNPAQFPGETTTDPEAEYTPFDKSWTCFACKNENLVNTETKFFQRSSFCYYFIICIFFFHILFEVHCAKCHRIRKLSLK